MHKCPKCSCGRISGPHYNRSNFGEELKYRCTQCGYTESASCHDNKRQDKAAIKTARIENGNLDLTGFCKRRCFCFDGGRK